MNKEKINSYNKENIVFDNLYYNSNPKYKNNALPFFRDNINKMFEKETKEFFKLNPSVKNNYNITATTKIFKNYCLDIKDDKHFLEFVKQFELMYFTKLTWYGYAKGLWTIKFIKPLSEFKTFEDYKYIGWNVQNIEYKVN